ncbi:MAG: hypothetical protein QY326_04205 [Bdellovibrionota bacterium]|nr:MAG: hypothetical protein QY326_04205 [Bdellovibrionota bacterium]
MRALDPERSALERFQAADTLSRRHHEPPTTNGEPYAESHLIHDAALVGLEGRAHRVLAILTTLPPATLHEDGLRPGAAGTPGSLYSHMLAGFGPNLLRLNWFAASPLACADAAATQCDQYRDCARFVQVHLENTKDALRYKSPETQQNFLMTAYSHIDRSVREFFPEMKATVTIAEVFAADVRGVHVDRPLRGYPLAVHDEVWCPIVLPGQAFAARSLTIEATWHGFDPSRSRPRLLSLSIAPGPVEGVPGKHLSQNERALIRDIDKRSTILDVHRLTPELLPNLTPAEIEYASHALAKNILETAQ